MLEDAISRYRAEVGDDDQRTLRTRLQLANTPSSEGAHPSALRIRRGVLQTCTRTLATDDPLRVSASWRSQPLCVVVGENAEARILAVASLKEKRRSLGEEHPDVQSLVSLLDSIDDSLGAA